MEGTALRNRWRVYPDDVVVWRSELPDLDDDRLGAWSGAVLAAGTETDVLIPITPVPKGPLPFAGVIRTATRLAYANSDGDVVEGEVADMADLVAAVSTPHRRTRPIHTALPGARPIPACSRTTARGTGPLRRRSRRRDPLTAVLRDDDSEDFNLPTCPERTSTDLK
jgi:hypothetical protein